MGDVAKVFTKKKRSGPSTAQLSAEEEAAAAGGEEGEEGTSRSRKRRARRRPRGTIATSPLGDTSEAAVGSRFLG